MATETAPYEASRSFDIDRIDFMLPWCQYDRPCSSRSRSLSFVSVILVVHATPANPRYNGIMTINLDEADLLGPMQDGYETDMPCLIQTGSRLSTISQNAAHLVTNGTQSQARTLDATMKRTLATESSSAFGRSFIANQCLIDEDCKFHARCDPHSYTCEAMALGQMLGMDVFMCALAFVIAGFSLAAGVGGGGLYVPLLMMVLCFDVRIASALSQAMLFGGAVAAFAYNSNGSHPAKPERPLISFELAGVMGTGLMGGAQVGSVIHACAPSALTLVLLIVVLMDSAKKSIRLAHKRSQEELEADKVETRPESDTLADPRANQDIEASTRNDAILKRSHTAKLQLFFIWLLCLAIIVIKGLFLPMCSLGWWLLTIAASVFLSGLSFYFAKKLASQEPVDMHDIDFKTHAVTLSWMSVLAGGLAALCGIGGGMVMGPLLVEMHVPPPVSSATTATTLIVLSSSTLLVYICRGVAPAGYSVLLSAFTMSGALAGKFLVGWWVQKTKKQSVIVWALVAVIILSTVLMGIQGVMTLTDEPRSAMEFRDFCPGPVTPTIPTTD